MGDALDEDIILFSNAERSESGNVRLRNSLNIVAHLIQQGSESLWPVFEKLEDELVRLEERENRLSRYSKF